MKKLVIIFWSGTGNTEAMATAVSMGAKDAGVAVEIVSVDKASASMVRAADAVALGCPSMGVEVLEESEMEPFVASLTSEDVVGKAFALFGSYDWGDGQWMRDWQDRMRDLGANLVQDGLIVQNTPDEEGLAACQTLGACLVAG